jgi:hypothetical protein
MLPLAATARLQGQARLAGSRIAQRIPSALRIASAPMARARAFSLFPKAAYASSASSEKVPLSSERYPYLKRDPSFKKVCSVYILLNWHTHTHTHKKQGTICLSDQLNIFRVSRSYFEILQMAHNPLFIFIAALLDYRVIRLILSYRKRTSISSPQSCPPQQSRRTMAIWSHTMSTGCTSSGDSPSCC